MALCRLERTGRDESLPAAGAPRFSLEERARIEAMLEELVERDYLLRMPDSTVTGESEFIFKHNLEHDLIHKFTDTERARRYHRLAAQWLDAKLPKGVERSHEQLEFLAGLYEKGGNAIHARSAYRDAASSARARGAYPAALELLERCLLLCEADDVLERIDPLEECGDALDRCGRRAEALARFQEMLEAAYRIDAAAKAGVAEGHIGLVHRGLEDYPTAELHFKEGLKLFRLAEDRAGIATMEEELGRLALVRGDHIGALDRHERALELRRALGDRRLLARSLYGLASPTARGGSKRMRPCDWPKRPSSPTPSGIAPSNGNRAGSLGSSIRAWEIPRRRRRIATARAPWPKRPGARLPSPTPSPSIRSIPIDLGLEVDGQG